MILIEYNFVLMKAYISISYNRRKSLNAEVNGIKEIKKAAYLFRYSGLAL